MIAGVITRGQTTSFPIAKGGGIFYGGHLYCYGLATDANRLQLKVYRLNNKGVMLDSTVHDLGKQSVEDYVSVFSDTLHHYLNIYLLKKNEKGVSIIRFNSRNELVANIHQVEIARLNNSAMFDNDVFYFKDNVYALKIIGDSSGRQFYLNKYKLKNEKENFDYEFVWQFPFERKNIQSAKIIYAGPKYVLMFVNVVGSGKEGQWVLRIGAESGNLIKGTKLNAKGETSTYFYGNRLFNTINQTIYLVGQKFSATQFSLKDNRFNIAGAPQLEYYLAEMDSTGELVNKTDFKISTREIVSGPKKTKSSYLLRFPKITRSTEGKFIIETDIYKSTEKGFCFRYTNSLFLKVNQNDESLVAERAEIVNNPDVDQFVFTMDKLDMNGKMCVDSIIDFASLYHRPVTLPIKLQYKYDTLNNPVWLLTKSAIKKNSISYSFLKPEKKIYKVSLIEEITKANDPFLIILSETCFVTGSTQEERKLLLKIYNW